MSCFAYLEFVRFKISEIKTTNKLHQHNRWNDFKSGKQQNNRIDSNIKTLTFFARLKLIEHVTQIQKMLEISALFWFFQAVDLLCCTKPCSTVILLLAILVGVAKILTCVVPKITCICNVCTKIKIYNQFMWFCDQFLCFVFAALWLLLFFFYFLDSLLGLFLFFYFLDSLLGLLLFCFIFLTVCWDCHGWEILIIGIVIILLVQHIGSID